MGKWFRLNKPTIALDVVDGKRKAVLLPEGMTVQVVRPADGEGLIGLQCDLGTLLMFAIDLTARGEPMPDRHTTASP